MLAHLPRLKGIETAAASSFSFSFALAHLPRLEGIETTTPRTHRPVQVGPFAPLKGD